MNENFSIETTDDNQNKFIFFHIGEEIFGTPLLDVREVIETIQVRKVPHSLVHLKGICNLRGQIVAVIDLAVLLEVSRNK